MVSTGIPIFSVFVSCMSMAALSLAPMVISGNLCSSYFCKYFLISCIKIGVTRDSRHSLLLLSCQSTHKEAKRPPADLDLTIFIGQIKARRVGDWRQLAITGQSINFSSLTRRYYCSWQIWTVTQNVKGS